MRTPLAALRRDEDPLFSLHREINRAFDNLFEGLPAAAPQTIAARLDVKEDEKSFQVTADLPGLTEKDIDLTFEDGVLTLRGEKKIERDEKKDTWHVIERSVGHFARQIALPTAVDPEKIEAKFDKGVLTITLPKVEEEKAKTKKIEIKS
jgi:HSP20 family protein